MRTIIAAVAALFFAATANAGEGIGDQTSCAEVRQIFDAEPPDMSKVREVFNYIEKTFTALDAKNAAKGKAQIYARMSAEGKQTTSAVVTTRCSDYPGEELRASAVAVYQTFAAMGETMGLDR